MSEKISKINLNQLDLISIIVPVYNIDKYIRKCLKSISAQTYKNIEVIVIDDGSTDKSGVYCDDFISRDGRFQVLHRKNGGPAKARNAGIRRAKGRYLVFVDGDDFVEKDFIEKLHSAIIENNSDIAVCGYISNHFKHSSNKCTMSGYDATVRLLTKQDNSDIVVWNKMYLASLFKEVRFTESKAYEDNLTTYKYYAHAKSVSFIPDALYHYTVRENSLMAMSNTYEHLTAKLMAAIEARKFFAPRGSAARITELKSGQCRGLARAAEFAEALAEFCFIDKAVYGNIEPTEFKIHRDAVLRMKNKLKNNQFTSKRVKFYLFLIRPFGGRLYKFFRIITSETSSIIDA